MSLPDPGDIEKPNVEPCDQLESVKVTYHNSRRCVTVTCPDGTFGEPVEVCVDAGTFTSTESQDEANARADALARELALAALHCSPEPILEDDATLNVTLLGNYRIDALTERANLAITFEGDYSISAIKELVSLIIRMTGEYKLEPMIDRGRLGITLSPISESRVPGISENVTLSASMRAVYQLATVLLSALQDRTMLTLTMSGAYVAPIVSVATTANASVAARFQSGLYTLVIVPTTQSDHGTLGANIQSGVYLLRSMPLPPMSERSSLSVTLRGGTYA